MKFPKFCFFLVVIGFASCLPSEPESPVRLPFDQVPEAKSSFVTFPLTIDLLDISRKLNSEIGLILYEDRDLAKDGRKVVVKKNGKIKLEVRGEKIIVEVPLEVWTEISLDKKVLGIRSRKTKETDFLINVRLSSPISIDREWKLNTDFRLEGVEWLKDPSVKLAFLKLNVRPFVESALAESQDKLLQSLNSVVREKVDLDQVVGRVWNNIQKPILINDLLTQVWLVVEPKQVSLGKQSMTASTLSVPIQVELLLKTSVGEKPIQGQSSLPKKGNLSGKGNYGFSLDLLSEIPYENINRVLQSQVEGHVFEAEGNQIIVDSVEVFGSGQKIYLKAKVSGSYSGTIFLSGTPLYDSKNNILIFDGLNYDISTEEVLLRTADWMFHEDILESLRSYSSFGIGQELEKLPNIIWKAIEDGKIGEKLEVNIGEMDIRPKKITVGAQGLWISISSTGNLGIELERL